MSELERLGQMADDFTPLPQRKPVLPLQKSHRFNFRRPVFAGGLAVVLLIAFLWSQALFTEPPKQMTAQLSTEMKVGLDLIDDILEASVLSEYYYGLDYGEKYRNLPYVGVLKPELYFEQPGN